MKSSTTLDRTDNYLSTLKVERVVSLLEEQNNQNNSSYSPKSRGEYKTALFAVMPDKHTVTQ